MLIVIKATTPLVEQHTVVLVMFKPHASLLCPSTQLLLNCSFGGWCFQSLLFETSRSSLSNRVTAEEVAAEHLTNSNCSRLIVLSVESSPCVAIIVCMLPFQPAGNAVDCQEWRQKVWILVTKGWFYVTIGDMATVNFTHNECMNVWCKWRTGCSFQCNLNLGMFFGLRMTITCHMLCVLPLSLLVG